MQVVTVKRRRTSFQKLPLNVAGRLLANDDLGGRRRHQRPLLASRHERRRGRHVLNGVLELGETNDQVFLDEVAHLLSRVGVAVLEAGSLAAGQDVGVPTPADIDKIGRATRLMSSPTGLV